MATINKNWASAVQIIGSGDGFLTLSGTTESFSSDVDLESNGYEGAHLIVEINYDASPSDEVEISLYGSTAAITTIHLCGLSRATAAPTRSS